MNRIWIGGVERALEDADPQWVHEQLEGRRREGVDPCVRVEIHVDEADVALSTPNCPSGPSTRRQANEFEKSLFDLWEQHHLRDAKFTVGNVVGFVKQVRQMI